MSVKILKAQVGYGKLGLGGELGFACGHVADKVILPHSLDCSRVAEIISAHADATIMLEFSVPVRIRGALAVSALDPTIRVWVDYHLIGTLDSRNPITFPIRLPAGQYTLRTQCIGPGHGAHSVFVVEEDHQPPSTRVALVCWAFYPEKDLANSLRTLYASAARVGVHVKPLGVNCAWSNLTESKIVWTANNLRAITDGYDYVCLIDGYDTALVKGEEAIIAACRDRVLIGAEDCSWPVREPAWFKIWTDHGIPRFINSGCIAGPRHAALEVMTHAAQTVNMVRERKVYPQFGHYAWCDQFVWHVHHLLHGEPAIDLQDELSISLGCYGGEIVGNKAFSWINGKCVSAQGGEPAIIHLCGPAKTARIHWEHLLS